MPIKPNGLTPREECERLLAEALKLKKTGELDPDAAEAKLDEMVRKSVRDHGA